MSTRRTAQTGRLDIPPDVPTTDNRFREILNQKLREISHFRDYIQGLKGPIKLHSALDMGGNRISALGTPQGGMDAVPLGAGDRRYVLPGEEDKGAGVGGAGFVSLVPGDVTIGTPVVSYFTDTNEAQRKVKVQIPITAPSSGSFHGFAGVQQFIESPYSDLDTPLDPTGQYLQDNGGHDYTGAPGGADTVEIIAPAPSRQEKWRFYLPSRTRETVNILVLEPAANASPSVLVTIDPSAAANVTNFDVGAAEVAGNGRGLIIPFSFNLPAGTAWSALDWSKMQIEIKTSSMAAEDEPKIAAVFDTNTGSPGAAVQSRLEFVDTPTTSEVWTLTAASYDTRGIRYSGAPTDTVSVGPPKPTQLSSISTSVPEYGTDEAGNHKAKVVVSYSLVADHDGTTWYSFYIKQAASLPSYSTTQHVGNTANDEIDFWVNRPTPGDPTLRYYIFAVRNSDAWYGPPDASSPYAYVDITAPAAAAQVTSLNVTVISGPANSPVSTFHFKYNFTKPTDPEFWYARMEIRECTDAGFGTFKTGTEWTHAMEIMDPPGEHAEWWPRPGSAQYWKVRSRSSNKGGTLNNSSIPSVNVTVTANVSAIKTDASGNVMLMTVGSAYPSFELDRNGIITKLNNALGGGYYAGLHTYNKTYTYREIILRPDYGIFLRTDVNNSVSITPPNMTLAYTGAWVKLWGGDGHVDVSSQYKVSGTKVIGSRQGAILDVSLIGYGTADLTYDLTEKNMLNNLAWNAYTNSERINAILAVLRSHGIIAT